MPLRNPRRCVFGMTWVGWLNVVLLQWLFVRLAYTTPDGAPPGWRLLRWIVPCTGWYAVLPYWYLGRRRG